MANSNEEMIAVHNFYNSENVAYPLPSMPMTVSKSQQQTNDSHSPVEMAKSLAPVDDKNEVCLIASHGSREVTFDDKAIDKESGVQLDTPNTSPDKKPTVSTDNDEDITVLAAVYRRCSSPVEMAKPLAPVDDKNEVCLGASPHGSGLPVEVPRRIAPIDADVVFLGACPRGSGVRIQMPRDIPVASGEDVQCLGTVRRGSAPLLEMPREISPPVDDEDVTSAGAVYYGIPVPHRGANDVP